MAQRSRPGATPFERLQHYIERIEATCPECGYEDDTGNWQAAVGGTQLRFRHVCPSCEARRTRSYALRR